ncbi:MAG: peptidylprolyl isomerase [Desulfobacterales bacterium]|nr:peptidylprolyl isomerase [Desulfobacterales bacterium]
MKKKFLFIIVIIFVFACSSDTPHLATISGEKVSKARYEAYLKYKRIPAADAKKREKAFSQYLNRTALAMMIEKEELLDQELLAAELDELKKEMLIGRYFEAYLNHAVSDQAVQNYYTMHPEEFETKKVHVAHILFRTNKQMGDAQRQAVLTTAHEAFSKLRIGAEFSDVAEDYSEDRVSGKKGGDLGWLGAGSIGDLFSEKMFSLKEGDVSEPFETPFGYHILKVLDEPRTVKQSFESVRGKIRYKLRENAKAKERERLMARAEIVREG